MVKKVIYVFVVISFFSSCLAVSNNADPPLNPITDVLFEQHFKYICNYPIMFSHVQNNRAPDTEYTVEDQQVMGLSEPFPDVYSQKNDAVLKTIEEYYFDRNYIKSYELLEFVWAEEKDNPIYLFYLGKTMYYLDDFESHTISVLEELISGIEDDIKNIRRFTYSTKFTDENLDPLIIDTWFNDAYWRLGWVYLYSGEYEKAAVNFNKTLLYLHLSYTGNNDYLIEIISAKLIEVYYHLNDMEMANYFDEYHKRVFPDSELRKDLF